MEEFVVLAGTCRGRFRGLLSGRGILSGGGVLSEVGERLGCVEVDNLMRMVVIEYLMKMGWEA